MVEIHFLSGNHEVTDDDRERAVAAAEAVFAKHGTTGNACSAAFMEWWETTDNQDYDDSAGLAAVWVEAIRAADVALTLGWARPDGASCTLVV